MLLIIAGITITAVTKDEGIIKRSKRAKAEARIAQIKEKIHSWEQANLISSEAEINDFDSTERLLNELKSSKLITQEEYDKAMNELKSGNPHLTINNGKEDIQISLIKQEGGDETKTPTPSPNPPQPQPPQSTTNEDLKKVQLGDIIKYDPLRGVTLQKLTAYISPKGNESGTTPEDGGNGYTDKTFTVERGMTEWVVLRNDNGKITLISKNPTEQEMRFKGSLSWLFAERELHKACSIYGYGKGADKSHITKYKVGNPIEPKDVKEEQITGSGARSLTLEDLEYLGNIGEQYKIGHSLKGNYGKVLLDGTTTIPLIAAKQNYKSSGQIYREQIKHTDYTIRALDNRFGKINKTIFMDTLYWIASRTSKITETYQCIFAIKMNNGKEINAVDQITSNTFDSYIKPAENPTSYRMRPVVHLAADVQLKLESTSESGKVYSIK